MRLVCTIGSMHILNPRRVLKRGDEFEIDDLKGSSLIVQGYAVQIPDVPADTPEPEENPPDVLIPEKKSTAKPPAKKKG